MTTSQGVVVMTCLMEEKEATGSTAVVTLIRASMANESSTASNYALLPQTR